MFFFLSEGDSKDIVALMLGHSNGFGDEVEVLPKAAKTLAEAPTEEQVYTRIWRLIKSTYAYIKTYNKHSPKRQRKSRYIRVYEDA